MQRWRLLAVLLLLSTSTCTLQRPESRPAVLEAPAVSTHPTPGRMRFTATAYSVSGTTASGAQTRRGIVAADPGVIPLGSRIHVHDAGAYSGVYDVEDTGRKIKGRIIDIYMPNDREARKFGRQKISVEILEAARK